jgi:hypothetical protein
MVPRAKKNLHECEYHLAQMKRATHFEEFEICFTAFVRSARNATWSLAKEFKSSSIFKGKFLEWYGDGQVPLSGTKSYEMSTDELCKFFNDLRTKIEHEGINGLAGSTQIKSFNSTTDLIGQPLGAAITISGTGIYYKINTGTAKEDLIPAKTRGQVTTAIGFTSVPKTHLGSPLTRTDPLSLSEIYYFYLQGLIEEWTEIINARQ